MSSFRTPNKTTGKRRAEGSPSELLAAFKKLRIAPTEPIDVTHKTDDEKTEPTNQMKARYGDWWGAPNVDGDRCSRYQYEFFAQEAKKKEEAKKEEAN